MAFALAPMMVRTVLLAGIHLDHLADLLDDHDEVALVGAATDAAEAVAIAGRVQPDVIIFDDCIDRFDAVAAAIATRRVAPGSTIVLLTGDTNIERAARRAGVDAVHGKSASLAALLA